MTWKEIFKSWFGRKIMMFYISIAVITTLTWSGKLSGDNFLIAFISVSGVSVAGNVMSKKFTLSNNPVG